MNYFFVSGFDFKFPLFTSNLLSWNIGAGLTAFPLSGFYFSDSLEKGSFPDSESDDSIKISYKWPDKKILIAEDEETNFIYLNTVLAKTNAKIFGARNGLEAVEAVRENPDINLVLMDIKMPEMNGIEATRIIKSMNKDIVVIAQTAYTMEEDRIMYQRAGCADYLSKPITKRTLLKTLARYL